MDFLILNEGNESTSIIFSPIMYKCNVICQLDRATVYLDIWLGIISGSAFESDSGRRLAFECVGWVKQLVLPNMGGSIQFVEGLKRRKKVQAVRIPSLSPPGCLLPAAPCTSGSQGFSLRLARYHQLSGPWKHHWLSWSSSLHTADRGTSQPPSLPMPVS